MAALSIQERKRLRQIGHTLNPVVMLGDKGLTENVIEELARALNDHELIKVQLRAERDDRKALIEQLCETSSSMLVQSIGKVALIYRKNPQPNKNLSNVLRYNN